MQPADAVTADAGIAMPDGVPDISAMLVMPAMPATPDMPAMQMYMYVRMHTHMHTLMHVHVHMHMRMHKHMHMHTHVHAHMHMCAYTCRRTHMCMGMRRHMHMEGTNRRRVKFAHTGDVVFMMSKPGAKELPTSSSARIYDVNDIACNVVYGDEHNMTCACGRVVHSNTYNNKNGAMHGVVQDDMWGLVYMDKAMHRMVYGVMQVNGKEARHEIDWSNPRHAYQIRKLDDDGGAWAEACGDCMRMVQFGAVHKETCPKRRKEGAEENNKGWATFKEGVDAHAHAHAHEQDHAHVHVHAAHAHAHEHAHAHAHAHARAPHVRCCMCFRMHPSLGHPGACAALHVRCMRCMRPVALRSVTVM